MNINITDRSYKNNCNKEMKKYFIYFIIIVIMAHLIFFLGWEKYTEIVPQGETMGTKEINIEGWSGTYFPEEYSTKNIGFIQSNSF